MPVQPSPEFADTQPILTEFVAPRPTGWWHRPDCNNWRAEGRAGYYRAEVLDAVRDYPVYGQIDACCMTKLESQRVIDRRALWLPGYQSDD